MLKINLNNVEKLLFYNKQAQTLLPEHVFLFDQWKLSRMLPGMRQMSKRSMLQLLDSITTDQIERLSEHFGMPVTIDTIDHQLVKNLNIYIDEAEKVLNESEVFEELSISRNGNNIYISSWR